KVERCGGIGPPDATHLAVPVPMTRQSTTNGVSATAPGVTTKARPVPSMRTKAHIDLTQRDSFRDSFIGLFPRSWVPPGLCLPPTAPHILFERSVSDD